MAKYNLCLGFHFEMPDDATASKMSQMLTHDILFVVRSMLQKAGTQPYGFCSTGTSVPAKAKVVYDTENDNG